VLSGPGGKGKPVDGSIGPVGAAGVLSSGPGGKGKPVDGSMSSRTLSPHDWSAFALRLLGRGAADTYATQAIVTNNSLVKDSIAKMIENERYCL